MKDCLTPLRTSSGKKLIFQCSDDKIFNEKMKLSRFECLVGGLPKVKKWPFCYKAPFSPIDVIEEYTRPARYVENGVEVVREPLTDCEYVEFEKVGTLESFNSDGT